MSMSGSRAALGKGVKPATGARALITSRFSDWSGWADEVSLDVLPIAEAMAFLTDRAGRTEEAGARQRRWDRPRANDLGNPRHLCVARHLRVFGMRLERGVVDGPKVGACAAALRPLYALIERHVLAAERLHGDDTATTASIFPTASPVRSSRRCAGAMPGGGSSSLPTSPPTRGKTAAPIAPIALEAVRRIDALFDIEREINGLSAAARLAARQEKSLPLVAALEGWMRAERATLSRRPCKLQQRHSWALVSTPRSAGTIDRRCRPQFREPPRRRAKRAAQAEARRQHGGGRARRVRHL
jgi:hypothetical protein